MGICDGRVAIVTGAGRGIGREHSLLLASLRGEDHRARPSVRLVEQHHHVLRRAAAAGEGRSDEEESRGPPSAAAVHFSATCSTKRVPRTPSVPDGVFTCTASGFSLAIAPVAMNSVPLVRLEENEYCSFCGW